MTDTPEHETPEQDNTPIEAVEATGPDAETGESPPDAPADDVSAHEGQSDGAEAVRAERSAEKPAEKPAGVDRIAKVMARAGVASRREAERMILEGRVTVNGEKIASPALDVLPSDKIRVDGKPLEEKQETRLWLYYKPVGLVTSESDEKGRQTVFDALPRDLPRVMSVGRLDLNSEGLLLLTNDGELKRRLELPATGWLRRYRVRVNGQPNDLIFKPLREGAVIDGEEFQPMEIKIDSQKGANAWLTVGIREGRNREIRRAMAHVGLMVNRLIRIGYGPFRLTGMEENEVKEIRRRVLKDQLGGLLTGEPDAEVSEDRPQRGRGPSRDGGKFSRGGDKRGFGGGERKPFGARKSFGPRDGERKPYGERDGERGGFKSRDGERKPYAGRDGGSRGFKPRDGERKPYESRDGDRGGFSRDGEKRGFAPRDGERKPYAARDEGGFKPRDGERRPYTPRDGAEAEGGRSKPRWNAARRAEGGAGAGERKPYGQRDGERGGFKPRDGGKTYGQRDGERKPYGQRDGERGSFKPRDGERKTYGQRDGERKPYGQRDGERKPYASRDGERGGFKPRDGESRGFKPRDGERKPYGQRDGESRGFKPRDGERKPYTNRDGESRGFNPRDSERKPYAPRDGKPGGFKPRGGKPGGFGGKAGPRSGGPRSGGPKGGSGSRG